jgi:hypothetical protein
LDLLLDGNYRWFANDFLVRHSLWDRLRCRHAVVFVHYTIVWRRRRFHPLFRYAIRYASELLLQHYMLSRDNRILDGKRKKKVGAKKCRR